MFSVFLFLHDYKMKKYILMDAFMKCYEKSPTKIPFLVWRTTTKLQATPASTASTATAPAARGWDEDDARFDVGESWDPHNPVGVINTCLKSLLRSLKSPWCPTRPECTLKIRPGQKLKMLTILIEVTDVLH
jgi:hypothetical protein